jgi:tetratricopeptide (TPR) repeat protein
MMKNKCVNGIFAALFVYTACTSLRAEGDAGQAGAFLRYGVGGRALGMGRAFVAISDDASGMTWNPAGLLGAKQFEIGTMYSNMYFDSRFSHFGAVLPIPIENPRNRIARFLLGPSTALGFSWIGFGMVGFEQRTPTAELVGHFGIQENAFAFAWAREDVNAWGVLRAGIGLKAVNQNFAGLLDTPDMAVEQKGRDWSAGTDLGVMFQPIHAPLFRAFALRYVLPLRFGLSVQNLIQPAWKLRNGEKDPFPRVFRWGMSYRWVLRDWIPKSWETLQSVVNGAEIWTALDWERYAGAAPGVFFGMEGRFPILENRLFWFPRFGINNQTERASLGMGITIPFAKTAAVRIDYAYQIHPDLPNDTRLFMTFQFGRPRDASFFKKQYEMQEGGRDPLLNIVADYPNPEMNGTVKLLSESDPVYSVRYNDLLAGIDRAEWLYQCTVELLQKNSIDKAVKKGADAAREYAPLFGQTENPLTNAQLTDYGEMLILTGQPEAAVPVLKEIDKTSLRSHYLMGTALKGLGRWDPAIAEFDSAIQSIDTRGEPMVQSMDCLSALGLAESLMKKGSMENALSILDDLLNNCQSKLDEEYPRYPVFADNYCVDDAQLLSGICLILLNRCKEGVSAILDADRFYPVLDYGKMIGPRTDEFIALYQNNDADGLRSAAMNLLDAYSQAHGLADSGGSRQGQ